MTPARCRKVKGTRDERGTEAPVNGGSNYNCPKVTAFAALVKSGYMLEHPRISRYSRQTRVTICGVRTISRKDHSFASGILRGHTPDLFSERKIWSDLHGDMQSVAEPK